MVDPGESPCFLKTVPLIFLALFVFSGCMQPARNVKDFSTDVPKLSAEGNSDKQQSLTSRNPEELVFGGHAYLAAGNPTLARLHFVTALQKDPQSAEAYYGLGRVEYTTGNYQLALNSYERATVLQPKSIGPLLGQAQVLRQMNKYDSAIEKINAAMKLAPNDFRVLSELAVTYDLQGQERLAAPLYQELIRQAPDQAAIFNNLGINHLARNEYLEAVAAFHRAFELDSRDVRIRNNLAMAFALQGSEDQALRLFRETVGEAAAWNNLGYLYMTGKRYDEAERALTKAVELSPKYYPRAQENLDRLRKLRQSER